MNRVEGQDGWSVVSCVKNYDVDSYGLGRRSLVVPVRCDSQRAAAVHVRVLRQSTTSSPFVDHDGLTRSFRSSCSAIWNVIT